MNRGHISRAQTLSGDECFTNYKQHTVDSPLIDEQNGGAVYSYKLGVYIVSMSAT